MRLPLLLLALAVQAVAAAPPDLDAVAWEQRIGADLPAALTLTDRHGQAFRLADALNDGPLVVAPVYYRCPKLCSVTLDGLSRTAASLQRHEARVLAFSFVAGETPADARHAARRLADRHPGVDFTRWRFLTGDAAALEALTDALGFTFEPTPGTNQFAHPAGIAVSTPSATVSRYLFGVEFPAAELDAALAGAARAETGTPLARLAMLCFDYDPTTGRYTLAVMKTVRLGGVLVVLAIAVLVLRQLRRERRGGDR